MVILLCTDGSQHSEVAARTLLALKPPDGAEIVALYVTEPLHYYGTPRVAPPYHHEWHRVQREMLMEAEAEAGRSLSEIEQIVAEAGLRVRTVIKQGNSADTIVATAEELQADLVVLGAKGFTGSQLFHIGSVAQKVTRYAPCSVLMTRLPGDAAAPRINTVVLATDGSEYALSAAQFLSQFSLPSQARVLVLHVLPQEPHWLSRFSPEQLALEQLRQSRVESANDVIEKTKAPEHTGRSDQVRQGGSPGGGNRQGSAMP